MEKWFRVTHQFNYYSSQSDMQSKQTRCASTAARLHGGEASVLLSTVQSFISEILQTALNVKGYPHLPVSFHRRLQVYI